MLLNFFFGNLWLVIATLDDGDIALASLFMASAPLGTIGEIIGRLSPHASLHESVEVVPLIHGLLPNCVHQVNKGILRAWAVNMVSVKIVHGEASFVEIILHDCVALTLSQALDACHDRSVVCPHFLNQKRSMCVCKTLPVAD